MTKLVPVEGNHALYRDFDSSAIVSTNLSEHKRYLAARKRKQHEKSELDHLKGEINENKEMLRSIVNGN